MWHWLGNKLGNTVIGTGQSLVPLGYKIINKMLQKLLANSWVSWSQEVPLASQFPVEASSIQRTSLFPAHFKWKQWMNHIKEKCQVLLLHNWSQSIEKFCVLVARWEMRKPCNLATDQMHHICRVGISVRVKIKNSKNGDCKTSSEPFIPSHAYDGTESKWSI